MSQRNRPRSDIYAQWSILNTSPSELMVVTLALGVAISECQFDRTASALRVDPPYSIAATFVQACLRKFSGNNVSTVLSVVLPCNTRHQRTKTIILVPSSCGSEPSNVERLGFNLRTRRSKVGNGHTNFGGIHRRNGHLYLFGLRSGSESNVIIYIGIIPMANLVSRIPIGRMPTELSSHTIPKSMPPV